MELFEKAKNYVTEKVSNVPMPEATISDVDFKGFGLDGITLLAKVSVSNPYSVPIPIGEIAYKVKSAERQIVSGSIPDPGSLKSNDNTLLEVMVKVPHSAVVSLVRDIGGDWDIDYILELGLIIDLPVVGNITIPMSYKGEMKLPTISDFFFGKSDEAEESDTKKSTVEVKTPSGETQSKKAEC
ncbi:hypothetical protein ACS0TY_017096 [Phlomoides rotata]